MILWKIFALFTRVALFSWGGGPASLALMQRECAGKGWVTSAEFANAVAMGNALPGPIAPQVSAYVGYKMAGFPGAIMAAAGTVLPTTILMLVMIVFFFQLKDAPAVKSMLQAVRPVVIGLLLWTAYDMASSAFGAGRAGWGHALAGSWDKVLIAVAVFAILVATKINPALIVIASAVFGYLVYK